MFSVRRLEAREFASQVLPALAEREAENNLMIGLALGIAGKADPDPSVVLAAVEARGRLVGACVRTPPRFPIVTRLPAGAARAVADFLCQLGDVPDGAIGPETHGHDLAQALADRQGQRAELVSDELVYELTELTLPAQPPGFARPATPDDLPVLTAFMAAFIREVALPHPPDPVAMAKRALELGTPLLWDDGGVRSMACWIRRMLSGSAIAPVYTPPEARGRGYASAVTAELCRRLLETGSRFVCLHADSKNPTSNHIYQAIGFRQVSTLGVWSLR